MYVTCSTFLNYSLCVGVCTKHLVKHIGHVLVIYIECRQVSMHLVRAPESLRTNTCSVAQGHVVKKHNTIAVSPLS